MRTAVVILNWNTAPLLERFLPGLAASLPPDAEVLVADSGSTDGSMELLAARFPEVRRIPLEENYGFTGGYNRAFRAVCGLPGAEQMEYFVLINSDIDVEKGWLEPLIAWMDAHPGYAACAPKLHAWQERDRFEYAGAAGGLIDRLGYPFCRGRVLKRTERDTGQYDGLTDVFWASGACLLVRREDFERAGGLDDRFFAHMEEIDLCWRLLLEGRKIAVVSDATVWHLGGGTLPADSPWKLRLNYRNNLLLLENNLAQSLALEAMEKGLPPEKAARKGCRGAKRTLLLRRLLDGLSALVYLFSGKPAYFRSVLEAHKAFRKIRKGIILEEIRSYARSHEGYAAPLRDPYWIVPVALCKGNRIFDYLRKRYENRH